MKLEDLPDDFTFDQFRRLDKDSLDKIPYTLLHWNCQARGCKNGTTIRDYGLDGWYFMHRNSKAAQRDPSNYWLCQNNYWLCGKHNKLFKRLVKSFSIEHIFAKLMDWTKQKFTDTREGKWDALGAGGKITQPLENNRGSSTRPAGYPPR